MAALINIVISVILISPSGQSEVSGGICGKFVLVESIGLLPAGQLDTALRNNGSSQERS